MGTVHAPDTTARMYCSFPLVNLILNYKIYQRDGGWDKTWFWMYYADSGNARAWLTHRRRRRRRRATVLFFQMIKEISLSLFYIRRSKILISCWQVKILPENVGKIGKNLATNLHHKWWTVIFNYVNAYRYRISNYVASSALSNFASYGRVEPSVIYVLD